MANAGGGGGSAGGIRAGRAFVELFTDSTQLEKGLKQAERQLASFGHLMMGTGLKVAGAGAAILTPLGLLADKWLTRGDKFAKASERIGDTAENLSLLDYAARQSGTSFDALEAGMNKMGQNLAAAAENGGEVADMLAAIGLSAKDLSEQSPTDQLLSLADALEKVDNQGQKLRLARGLAGKGAAELLPLLSGGNKGIRSLMAEGVRTGSLVSTEEAKAAEKVGDSLSRVWEAAQNAVLKTFSVLVPTADTIEAMSQQVVDLIGPVRAWIADNKALVIVIASVGAGLVIAGGGFLAVGLAASGAASMIGLAGTALTAVGAALGLIASPLGIVALAVAGISLLVLNFSEDARGAVTDVMAYFQGMADTFNEAWSGINAALAKGDLKLAFSIAMAGINVEWKKLIVQMTLAWNGFKAFFVDSFHAATTAVAKAIVDVMAFLDREMPSVFGGILNGHDPAELKRSIDLDEAFAQRKRDESRKADADAARAAEAQAKAELAALTAKAKAERELAPMPRAVGGGGPQLPESAAARGLFASRGFGAQALGESRSNAVRQVKAAEKQVALLQSIDDKLGNAGPLVLT